MDTMSFRSDENVKKELAFIQKLHQTNQSQAIKEAIHTYYLLLKQNEVRKSPAESFADSGFVGSFKANKNLSVSYKQALTKSLKKKHGTK